MLDDPELRLGVAPSMPRDHKSRVRKESTATPSHSGEEESCVPQGGEEKYCFQNAETLEKRTILANENGRQNKCYPGYLLKLLKENKL